MIGCPSSLIGNNPVSLSEGLLILANEHSPLRNQLESIFSLCTAIEEEKETSFEKLTREISYFSTKIEQHSVR